MIVPAANPLPAELMVTARIRMERALYDRAEAVAQARGQSFADFVTGWLEVAVAADAVTATIEAAVVTRDAEAQAA